MKKVFIADFLPLANKGEEEIIRGIETLYCEKTHDEIEFCVFGDVDSVTRVRNVIIYPRDICYPVETKYAGKKRVMHEIWMAIKGLIGIYQYKNNVLKSPDLLNDLQDCDKVLIGHDGFFNLRCALLGLFLSKKKIKYSILGAGFNRPGKKVAWIYDKVFKRCFDKSEYIILREQTAFDYVRSLSRNVNVQLLPDPAFFCPSNKYNKENIEKIITKYGIDNTGLKIGVTICENSISFSTAFRNSSDKVNDHRDYIKNILCKLSRKYHCTFYFLPHCIEEGAGNDLVIARDIVNRVGDGAACKIITEDMPVLDIKYLISKMDVMIGERTHSIINSISTETPFVVLTCSADFRTHDIVGKGCNLENLIFDLDYPNNDQLVQAASNIIEHLEDAKIVLSKVCLKNQTNRKRFIETI